MTNYNERLDEILKTSHHRIRTRILRDAEIYQSHIAQSEYEAKQAITSLIKELVAEAKPLLKEKTSSTEFTTWDRKTKVVKTFESETDPGFNKAINEFEQNLLKALEEV